MSSELLATYAGLGTREWEGEEYYRGEECLACVKDLIRALRSDSESCEIRRQLGLAGILQKDLLPILVSSADDDVLRNDVIRLLVNLTQPAYLCFGSSYPKRKESDTMKCFMEVNVYLRKYKEAFTAEDVMNVLGSILADLCQKDWDNRDDDDIIVIERILLLIRNILHITPDKEEEKRTEEDVSVHDQIIWNLHVNGIDELLLFLGSNPDESQWCMHVLEIVFLALKEQSASSLAKTGKGRTAEEKKRDDNAVEEVLARERAKRAKAQKLRGSRHSRFGGTFVVKNQASISGSERVYHRSLSGLKDYSYDFEKRPRRTPKPRRPTKDIPKERLSTYSIRVVLKNMCVQFLECCYNPLMRVVKDNIKHQRAMDNDETYYLWGLRFFMEFSRVQDFRVDIVGETLQLQTLHYIIQLMANYYESMVIEKKQVSDAQQWGQRLHYAVQAYRELLLYVQEMGRSGEEAMRENAKVMQSNVFYHPEYRDVFVTLLRNFNAVLQTRSSLCVLVETTHIYIRIMERYCRDNKHIVVREQKRKGKKSKKSKKSGGNAALLSEDKLIDLWEKMDARVAELLEGSSGESLPDTAAVPFDAASDVSMDDQKFEAMGRVKQSLVDACHGEAVSLMRAAREVWPDDVFGRDVMPVDEELDVIKEILLNPQSVIPAARLLEEVGEGDNEEEGEVEGGEVHSYELEFDLKKYLQRFSNNKIVRAYCLVLADYRSNSDQINHAVVKMLHQIAVDLKMAALLYQISALRTMQAILSEPPTTRYKELQKFSRYIVASFFHMASGNPMMFVELLFWKTSQDCYELEMGYGTLEREKQRQKLSSLWTREQEEELAELYERFKDDEDVVACIEAALPQDLGRNRRQIASQLVKQGLVDSRKGLNKKQTKKKKDEWTDDNLSILREVFQPQDDIKAAMKEVADYFPDRGVRDIGQQLKMMGLIPDKKRTGKRKSSVDGSDSDSERPPPPRVFDEDDGMPPSSPPASTRKRKKTQKKKTKSSSGRWRTAVSDLHRNGYSHQLAWLEAYFTDEARDRAVDDEWEEMCVVPVSEQISRALQTEGFQDLLASLGLQAPTQQEVYWRIPPTMTPSQLTAAASALRPSSVEEEEEGVRSEGEEDDMGGEGASSPARSGVKTKTGSVLDSDDSEEEEFEDEDNISDTRGVVSRTDALAALLSKRKSQMKNVEEERASIILLEVEEPKPKKPRLTHANFLDSDSENEQREPERPSPAYRDEEEEPSSQASTRQVRKKARQLMDSDSEDDISRGDISRCVDLSDHAEGEGLGTRLAEGILQSPLHTLDLSHTALPSDYQSVEDGSMLPLTLQSETAPDNSVSP